MPTWLTIKYSTSQSLKNEKCIKSKNLKQWLNFPIKLKQFISLVTAELIVQSNLKSVIHIKYLANELD
jgi:hypothetical protein